MTNPTSQITENKVYPVDDVHDIPLADGSLFTWFGMPGDGERLEKAY